ncbi:hypothetical protein [Aromatoleum petrolei]|uniref:Integrase catalytic domain-containing protein n=1 Tax=Aromatoleum petrolei TaxID=76116 RepID=A0ABX1MN60_9RHOO|nr:hypothetical protein [Aromatoleum petrolei]NMF88111.1 hypothetical protein [Aromatoleum petrolei]QTQ38898.1 Uncharacterized protein ToN1_48040 [Aromatoleum petrolei]
MKAHGNHYTFKTLPQEYRDITRWRCVDEDALQEEELHRFAALREAITAYVRTGKLSGPSKASGVSEEEIIRQLNRCVTLDLEGQLVGWPALLKFLRIGRYSRATPPPVGPVGTAAGFAGAFSKFLGDHPQIREQLDDLIKKRSRKGKIHEVHKSIRQLARDFADLCRAAGVREDEYPLNTKSTARKSIERYVNDLVQCGSRSAIAARYGQTAADRLSVGTGISAFPLALAPYDVGGIDAHEEHCIGCIIVNGVAGPQLVPVERIWIVCFLDEISRAILGYSVGIRTEISSAVAEQSLIFNQTPWQPRPLSIPGFKYAEGAGFPSGVIPELLGCFPAVIKFDNAAAHHSIRISENARKRIGAALTYGKVADWAHNHALERVFKTLETYGFQRLPSTTGSNTQDPVRPKNPVREAIRNGITLEGLLDLTDVVLANYNATPSVGLGGQSPLQVLRNHLFLVKPTFLPRRLPPPSGHRPELGVVVETRFVRGNTKEGRRPYVQIDRVRYTGPVLARSFGFIGSQLRIHIHEANMQQVQAYLPSGIELETLSANGGWGRTPHSREMRAQINALCDAGELWVGFGDDPVEKLLEYYANKAYKEALERPTSVSRTGTKLANAAYVSGLPIPTQTPGSEDGQGNATVSPGRPVPASVKRPIWKSVT